MSAPKSVPDCNKPLSLEAEREQWLDQLIADPGLKSSYFRVAWAIACHMNRNENGWAWPGFNRLAEKAGLKRRATIYAVNWMESRGHLRIVRKRNGDRNDPNHYRPILKAEAEGSAQACTTPSAQPCTTLVHGRAPEPLIEPLNTAAGSSITDRSSWERVLEALGTTSDDLKWINQRHRFNQWLAGGFDLDLDILPTISRLSNAARQRGRSISSLNYFNQAIAEARVERLSPPTVIASRKGNGKSNLLEYINNDLRQSAGDKSRGPVLFEDPLRLLPTIRSRGPHDTQ